MPGAAFKEQQREAKRTARAIRETRVKEVAPGLRLVPITVDAWLCGYRCLSPDERSDTTKENDAYQLAQFRRSYGKRLMHDITPIQAQAWALRHPSQIHWLRSAWDQAVRMQVVPLNVWRFVTLPARTKPKVRPPSDEELARILLGARERFGEQFVNMILVAAYSGARQGGLLRLRRSDVDLDSRRMTVTEKGEKQRSLVLAGPALTAMREQFELRERHYWQFPCTPYSPYVFVNTAPLHMPLDRSTIRYRWQQIRGDFPFGFHSLKHYASTWLAAQGADELDIAVQLGHVDSQGRPYPELVRRVYGHAPPEAALARIEGLIARPQSPQRAAVS